MAQRIFKFRIQPGVNYIDADEGADFLSVDMVTGQMSVYAEVDDEGVPVKHKVVAYATGEELPNFPGEFLGTVVVRRWPDKGHMDYVWHVYYEGDENG